MSSSSIPGADVMQDSLEFIKKMWGGMGVPGMVVPTLSVEEINKKIRDLKAVESWLNLNLNMLRTTIQALEVQSATISALEAMAAVNQMGAQMGTQVGAQAAGDRQEGSDSESGTSPWAIPAGFPFSFMNPAKKADVAPAPAPAPAPAAQPAAEAENPPSASGATDNSAGTSGAWWDLLQNQFKQAVNSVVAAEKMVMPTKAVADDEAKPTVKPRSKANNGTASKPGTASKSAGKKGSTAAGGKTAARSSKAKVVPKE
ncbi:PhaM family polyhydroxyalkanoate granule multifunctional regulatory protein [Collimonas silvisoli]|uniref:PhaM family polyhydroxyalkanoate granule multifunctional regulatory protein n=1 Tax=Collimonas silvisoli TaxID=2825884 RepID=UPI001B8B1DE9|nr:PhaM family polyhydroxyalkanoate granule multifunctional regulatory protein [Collimonas silvisoli]